MGMTMGAFSWIDNGCKNAQPTVSAAISSKMGLTLIQMKLNQESGVCFKCLLGAPAQISLEDGLVTCKLMSCLSQQKN